MGYYSSVKEGGRGGGGLESRLPWGGGTNFQGGLSHWGGEESDTPLHSVHVVVRHLS